MLDDTTQIRMCKKHNCPQRQTEKGRWYCPQHMKEYQENNKEKIASYQKEWKEENKEHLREYNETHKSHKSLLMSQWREENKDHIAEYRRKYNEEVKHPDYAVWVGAKGRCYNPKNPKYESHGRRGITMYQPWVDSFEEFISYMGPRPEPKHSYSIDRINNDGNYEPGNVRWATRKEQANNKRNNVSTRENLPDTSPIEYDGCVMSIVEFSEIVNIPLIVIKHRYVYDRSSETMLRWDIEDRNYLYKGEMYNLHEICLISNGRGAKVRARIKSLGWPVEKALETP